MRWRGSVGRAWSCSSGRRKSRDAAPPNRPLRAKTTHWHSLPLPSNPDPNIPRVLHPISGTDADRPRVPVRVGHTAFLDRGGVLWITLEGKPYYWDGDRFRKPLAYDLAFTQWTDTFFGGDDRELYASQHGEQDKNEGKIYRLHDGRIDPVCDFDYDTSVERPGLHVMKSGLLLNWGEKFIEVYAKGRWNRTEASLSTGRTKLVEVGDRVCLLYFDHLYVIAPDGKVSAAKHYLDDPSIASNKTRGEYWKSFVSTKLNAAAWGKDRLLLMAPGLTGYDLAAGKLIDVGWIEARVHAGGVYAHLFTDRQGAAWIGVDERWWEGRGIFYRVTPEGEIRREAGTSAFAVEAVYDLRDPLIASDGSLWFVLARGRVARYRDGRAEIMGPSNGIRGPVHSLLEGRNGEVFATTDYGLFVYDPKRPPAPLPRLTDHWDEFTLLFWTNPIRDSEGNLWALRADRPGEISRWDGRAWRHQHVPFDAAKISCSMADDRGHVLLGKVDVRYDVSPAGVTTYTDFRDALVAAIARGARRFQPSRCVAVDGGKKLCAISTRAKTSRATTASSGADAISTSGYPPCTKARNTAC